MVSASLIPGFAGHLDPQHPYDVILAVPPEHYIVFLDGKAFPSLRFGKTPRIASNLLQNHELVFDLDHNRIGVAERLDCPEGLTIMNSLHTKKARIGRGKKAKSLSNQGDNLNGSVEGVEIGEFSSNGTVLTPEDRNFIVVGSDSSPHAPSTGSGNGLNMEFELEQTSVSSKHENSKGRMIGGSNEGDNLQRNESSKGEHPGKLVEPQDGLPKPDVSTGPETPGTVPGKKKTSEHALASSDTGQDPYNWMDFIGLMLFLMSFSLTVYFTQDNISDNWLFRYFRPKPDQVDDIGDDAEFAKAAWSKGKSFYHNIGSQPFKKQKSVVGQRRLRQASFSTARTSQSEESSQKTGSSGRPYYDASKSNLFPPSSASGSKSFNENFYQAYSVPLSDEGTSTVRSFHDSFEQSSRSFYSGDSYADVRKPPYTGLARESSATSFNSDSMDDLHYPSTEKANFRKFGKPINSRDRSALTREPSAGSRTFSSDSTSGYDRPSGDEYYHYGDDDDYTRGDGTYYDDRTTNDGTFNDSPQYASFASRGQESFMSRGDEYPMYESFESRGGNIYDRNGDAGASQTPYFKEKSQFDSDNYSDVESFYADEASLPPQKAKGSRYYRSS